MWLVILAGANTDRHRRPLVTGSGLAPAALFASVGPPDPELGLATLLATLPLLPGHFRYGWRAELTRSGFSSTAEPRSAGPQRRME